MINSGVLRLKKLKAGLLILTAIFLAGCKTLPAGRTVDPIELLDNESAFYIAIPKAADNELIERIVTNNIQNISDSDVKNITSRVNKVYCGLSHSKNHTEIQATIDSDIPVSFIPKALNKKNGWSVEKFTPQNSVNEYSIYNYNDFSLSFPNGKIACLGRGMPYMLNRYDTLSALPAEDMAIYSELDEDLVTYLKDAETEIRFFANRPQSFLTILTGAQLDLKLIDVKGSFVSDPKHENQYLLNLDFNFRNEKYLKAGKTLLTLAFGLTNSQSIIIGTSELQINGIRIDKNQLYKLLVL